MLWGSNPVAPAPVANALVGMGWWNYGTRQANNTTMDLLESGTVGQQFAHARTSVTGDRDPVSPPARYFRRHWDSEFDGVIPMSFDRLNLLPRPVVVLQAMNRAATR